MAGKSNNRKLYNKNGSDGGASFADVRYTAEDQAAFSEWLVTNDATLTDAMDALDADLYRMTFKSDLNNNCKMVTVTQIDESKHKNSGIILTVRASTFEKAALLAAWTIFEMYPNGPLPLQGGKGEFWI